MPRLATAAHAPSPNASPGAKPASAKPAGAKPPDWRAATLAHVRALIQAADPAIVEERKWSKPTNPAGVPVFSLAGILCTGETHKQVVKLTFARGAVLPDPHRLFNAGLEGNVRRAIDLREGAALAASAFQQLIRAAVAANTGALADRAAKRASTAKPKASAKKKTIVSARPVQS